MRCQRFLVKILEANFKRSSLRVLFLILIFSAVIGQVFFSLFFHQPLQCLSTESDKLVASQETYNDTKNKPFFTRKHSFDCAAIVDNSTTEIVNASQTRRPLKSEYAMSKIFADCKTFRQRHYYPKRPLSESEAAFPLAFVILLNEHLEQIEILFNAIFAPQNSYCFHVDLKASHLIHYSIQKLSACFPEQVFFLSESLPVTRESSRSIHAIVNCFDKLVTLKRQPSWKYVLTLQGHDFPLRTNRELVEILKMHQGMNDIELTSAPLANYNGTFEETTDSLGQPAGLQNSQKSKPPIPDERLTIYKGNIAGSFSRKFAEFVLTNNISQALLNWLDTAYTPDEMYFSTLNHNEFLNPPGGYPGRCVVQVRKSWVSRFSIWQWFSDKVDQVPIRNYTCRGSYRNAVCLLSSSELPMLVGRPELFLNKFWISTDPIALDCMHEILYNRTLETALDKDWKLPHSEYYAGLAAIKYKKWRHDPDDRNSSSFECVTCVNCEH